MVHVEYSGVQSHVVDSKGMSMIIFRRYV